MWSFLKSIKTTALGIMVIICGGTAYMDWLPEQYAGGIALLCATLVGLGLIAAKDANVTNAAHPVEATKLIAADLPPAPPSVGTVTKPA